MTDLVLELLTPLRACKHCGVVQPLARFPRATYFSPGVYHEHKCKTCYARGARERYQSDRCSVPVRSPAP